jgi:hypothetical protein
VTRAAEQFWAKLQPVLNDLRAAVPAAAQAAVWRSRRNEIYHFCQRGEVESFNSALDAWQETLYAKNIPYRVISSDMLEHDHLEGIRLLILPMPYYLSQAEADTLMEWVAGGGILISEAHLMGYNADSGRHSRSLPGGGLAEAWGMRESFSSAARHVSNLAESRQALDALPPDVRKALAASAGNGSNFFAFTLADGKPALGAQRYAEILGEDLTRLGGMDGREACLISKAIGAGRIFYAGTHLSEAAGRDDSALQALLTEALTCAGVQPEAETRGSSLHVDLLTLQDEAAFAVLMNQGEQAGSVKLPQGSWQGIFGGEIYSVDEDGFLQIPSGTAELLKKLP